MKALKPFIYPGKDELVEAFVSAFISFLEDSARRREKVHVALSGGSTPLAVFRELAHRTDPASWEFVHLYWGDERCVNPSDPESNYGQARALLIDPLGLPAGNIHRIKGEEDPETGAASYAALLSDRLPSDGRWPVFDWIWLGMGADGHTASIFPYQLELWDSASVCVQATHPESGQRRISLSGGVINAALRVSLLVSGEEKAPVIRELFHKEGAYLSYPVFYVEPERLECFLDKEAAGQL